MNRRDLPKSISHGLSNGVLSRILCTQGCRASIVLDEVYQAFCHKLGKERATREMTVRIETRTCSPTFFQRIYCELRDIRIDKRKTRESSFGQRPETPYRGKMGEKYSRGYGRKNAQGDAALRVTMRNFRKAIVLPQLSFTGIKIDYLRLTFSNDLIHRTETIRF